jgi:DNA repair protein RadC
MRRQKVRDIPTDERPRERLIALGPSALSNTELLAILLGTGSRRENAISLAGKLIKEHDIPGLSEITVPELKKLHGISNAKACSIMAGIELGKRTATLKGKEKMPIISPEQISQMISPAMRNLKKEVLTCIYVDSKCRLLKMDKIATGGLNSHTIHAREIFRNAISESAAGIILVHNHPSGDPTPSKEDISATSELSKAGKLIGIELMDHIIIGSEGYVSLKEKNLF